MRNPVFYNHIATYSAGCKMALLNFKVTRRRQPNIHFSQHYQPLTDTLIFQFGVSVPPNVTLFAESGLFARLERSLTKSGVALRVASVLVYSLGPKDPLTH